MSLQPFNLQQKLSQFSDQWRPKIVGEMHGFQFKLAKLEGGDEAVLVSSGMAAVTDGIYGVRVNHRIPGVIVEGLGTS